MNTKKRDKMPILGIGPIYVTISLLLTILGILLDQKGYLKIGKINSLKAITLTLGIILIAFGIFLWIKSVLVDKITSEIKKGHIVTSGVYSIVRNPVYSAFTFIFTGVLLLFNNLLLLILPFIFWLLLTILLKSTEEKWMIEKFGDEYINYSKRVNRIIPWFKIGLKRNE